MLTALVAAIGLSIVVGTPAIACVEDGDCDDCNVCTTDTCDQVLGCTSTAIPGCDPCASAGDCADGNPCTDDVCDCGACQNPPVINGTPCLDGFVCNGTEVCLDGMCMPGTYPCLSDFNLCTFDYCSEETMACEHEPLTGTACDDGDACTTVDACLDGVCTGGGLITACLHGDGCCPPACQGLEDDDCPQGVGDQLFEAAGCAASPLMRRISEFEPLGQSFTPTRSALTGVDVYVQFQGFPFQDTLTLNVRDGGIAGPVVGSATSFVDEPGFHRFDLPSPVALTAGHQYVIELDAGNFSSYWRGCSADGYAGGEAIQAGAPVGGQDMFFRTFAPESVPELSAAGRLILGLLLPLAMGWMDRRRRATRRERPGGTGRNAETDRPSS